MYPKLQTDAIVIASYAHKENDRVFVLYTKEFGLLHARALSGRKLSSKLKHSISGYLISQMTLIRGKSGWRIVEAHEPDFHVSSFQIYKLHSLYRVFKRVLDMATPLETNMELFNLLKSIILAYRNGHNTLALLEVGALHDVLARLGYINAAPFCFENGELNLLAIENKQEDISAKIQNAIESSHL